MLCPYVSVCPGVDVLPPADEVALDHHAERSRGCRARDLRGDVARDGGLPLRGPCRCCRGCSRSSTAARQPRCSEHRARRATPRRRRSSARCVPPRRMRWQSGLPVGRDDRRRALLGDRQETGAGARPTRIASMATCTLPSVPFLKPTGIDRPDASSRWIWLSVVRAPIAPQATRSAMNCGVIGSRNSVPAGSPMSRRSIEQAARQAQPLVDRGSVPSRCGSLMRPFQPTVVRGFSK